jgi:hypothetical protein
VLVSLKMVWCPLLSSIRPETSRLARSSSPSVKRHNKKRRPRNICYEIDGVDFVQNREGHDFLLCSITAEKHLGTWECVFISLVYNC